MGNGLCKASFTSSRRACYLSLLGATLALAFLVCGYLRSHRFSGEENTSAIASLRLSGAVVDPKANWKERNGTYVSVHFEGKSIGGPDISPICMLVGVSYSSFKECRIACGALAQLANAKALLLIEFDRCTFEEGSLFELDGNAKIESLRIVHGDLDTMSLRAVKSLPELTSFSATDCVVTANDIAFLRHSPKLASLSVARTPLDDLAICQIIAGHQLVKLDVSGTRATDAILPCIGAQRMLKRLVISDCDVTDGGLGHLSKLHELYFLGLSRTRISDSALDTLRRLPELHELAIDQTVLTDAAVPVLAAMPRLRFLSARGTQITPEMTDKWLPRAIVHFLPRTAGPGKAGQ